MEMLKDNGHIALPAGSASKALEIYRKNSGDIDLVILDMMMPEIGGEEAFHLLRTINPDVKIIICSGYSRDGKAEQLLKTGGCGFLQKPFDNNQLMTMISEALKPA